MIEAILLYGSKARNDSGFLSDTDLIGISADGKISKHFDARGMSFHVYPLPWLLEQSENGTLFLLHIAHEAVPVYDPDGLLELIRKNFKFKTSYLSDLQAGVRVVAAIAELRPQDFNSRMRTRFFWGLRTALMAAAADRRQPIFSSRALEQFHKIDGLASLIRRRQDAAFEDCQKLGYTVIKGLGEATEHVLHDSSAANMRALLDFGGLATLIGNEIIYR